MPRGRPRKTRVTKRAITAIKEAKRNAPSSSKSKRMVSPGPWTNLKTTLKVKANLRVHKGLLGDMYGTYKRLEHWGERGWYPVIFNITSKSIQRDVAEQGIDNYMAACEKDLNSEKNKKLYGTIILLEVGADNSQREARDQRFISCIAKTNKKSIVGFAAIRKGIYQVL